MREAGMGRVHVVKSGDDLDAQVSEILASFDLRTRARGRSEAKAGLRHARTSCDRPS